MKKCTSNINGDVIMKKTDAIRYNSQMIQQKITKQQEPNTNKSEYAFNTNINKDKVKINNCNGIKVVVKMQKQQQQQINNKSQMMVSTAELLVLLPFNESEQQSGIVTDLKEKFKKMWDDACMMGIMINYYDAKLMIMMKMLMKKQANELLFVQQLEAMPWPLIPKQMLISFDDEVLITLIVVEIIIILIITKISHISDENIKTVNKKCDLIDYLTKTNIKVNYYDYYANFSVDKQATIQHKNNNNNYYYDNNDQNMCIDIKGINDKKLNFIEKPTKMIADDVDYHANITNNNAVLTKPSFTTFDELCQLQLNEKRILAEAARQNKTIRLRLAGGGEGSLTNPQTGWGSPPNSQITAGNPNAGSWGAANPPSQWGQGQNPGQQQRPLNSGPPQDSVNKNQNSVPNQAQGPPNMAATVQGQSGNSSAPNSNQPQQGGLGAGGNSANNPQQQQQGNPQQVVGAGNNNGNFPPIGANAVGGAVGAAGNNGGANPPGNGNGGAGAVAGQAGPPSAAAKNQLEQLNTMREALFSQDGWSCQNVNQDTNWDVPGSPEPGLKSDPNTPVQPLWKTGMNNGTELWEANLKCGGQPPPAPVAKSQWTPKVPFGGTWGADDEEENATGTTVWNTNQQNNPSTAGGWNQNQGPVGNAGFNAAPAPKLENEWNANPGNNWGDLRQQPPQTDPRNLPANLMRDNSVGSGTGISGRLNPNNIDWAQNKGPMMGVGGVTPTNGQWPQTGPKEMPTGKPSGWVEGTSPPRVGRPPMPDYNDGTNLWQQNQRGVPGGAGPHWKDMPDGSRPNMPRPGVLAGANPGPIQSRLGPSGPLKQDMWQSGARTSWDEPPHTSGWEDGNKIPGGNANNAWDTNCWTNKPKPSGWPDNDLGIGSDWAHGQKAPNKMVSSEIIRNSKQFRTLIDLGYKKEDAEIALRTTSSFEEAIDLLNQRSGAGGGNLSDQWRRHDEHPNAFDHPPRFPGAPTPTMPFPPNSNPNILGNLGSNLTGNQINKMSQMPPNYAPPGSGPNFGQQPGSGTGTNPQQGSSQPSTQQLRMLVQQIQTAVHAGFLNHQILNQPLAPQTLILLNQLLTCIKQLQLYQSSMNRPGVNAVQANIITSKLQQQIKTLQNQITAQQQMYVKQAPSNMPNPNDYLRSPTDPAGSLINAFPDLNIGGKPDPAGFNQSISRLESQWKVGSKDSSDPSEFSRAPGTTAKSSISATPSIGLGSDSPWSSSVSGRDGGWPEPSTDSKDVDWPSQPSPAFSELVVPEFKPGEPWKGTQQKSIEDDPSITPGSVARSPLSIAAKDSDLFSGASKTSPEIQPISLSNSTWSFTPSGQQSFSSAKANSNSTWSDTTPPIPKSMPTSAADLWSSNKAPRGPPPGLGSTKSGSGNGSNASSNNWMGLIGGRNSGSSGSGNWQSSGGSGWFSSWLLLKNLTAQIDGSTLRTLCMQHGPLQNFHLYLTHGIALCKYSSREEAQKAQTALNNCVLGNTTICAESPSENEVQSILQHLGAPSGGGGGNGGNGNSSASAGLSQTSWRPPSQGGPARPTGGSDAWASSWPTGTSSGNLWTPIDGVAGERGTPSNLSTFLPENLLGTELN